jgi:hypothetical protein
MSEENLLKNIPNFILKYYDMRVETRTSHRGKISENSDYVMNIYTWIIFTPKEINEMTPKETNFYCYWGYRNFQGEGKYSYEDATYIRKNDMPILQYISGEFYLDEFCEKIGKNIAEDVVEKSKSQGKVYGEKISRSQAVYTDFNRNDFVNESNLKESIRKVLREETLEENGVMDSLKKFFGKQEKTPEDRLLNIIVKFIKEHYSIDFASNDYGEITYYETDYTGVWNTPIMKYLPKYKRLEYSRFFAEDINKFFNDDRLLQPDSELMGKIFEKLYKNKVNKVNGYNRI